MFPDTVTGILIRVLIRLINEEITPAISFGTVIPPEVKSAPVLGDN